MRFALRPHLPARPNKRCWLFSFPRFVLVFKMQWLPLSSLYPVPETRNPLPWYFHFYKELKIFSKFSVLEWTSAISCLVKKHTFASNFFIKNVVILNDMETFFVEKANNIFTANKNLMRKLNSYLLVMNAINFCSNGKKLKSILVFSLSGEHCYITPA